MITLDADQQRVYDAAEAWLRVTTPRRPYWVYDGPAGTGKTVVLAALARAYPQAITCTFTGKAASVLRARSGLDVTTVHSAIYDFKGLVEDEDSGKPRPVFNSKEVDFTGRLVLLDEHGTVGSRLGEDLVATGARIIACGDPYQLRPVRDSRYFDQADATLTKVRRQALNSPIIRQAHAVKDGRNYHEDGEDFRVITKAQLVAERQVAFGGIALCWRNETRKRLNVSRRKALGYGGEDLQVGEPIMMLKNDHAKRVFNGEIYSVACRRRPGEDLQVTSPDGRKVILECATVEGLDPEFEQRRNEEEWSPVALAYATTVHKFQGSEADDVLLVDEYDKSDQREAWLYTGITRAAKRMLVVTT